MNASSSSSSQSRNAGTDDDGERSSVCREFYTKFPLGKPRNPEEVADFIANHSSSRKKIEEWLQSQDGPRENGLGQTEFKYSKSNIKSQKQRELGNEYFKKKKLHQSLVHYNESIKHAPSTILEDESSESCLSMALANRSAVLLDFGVDYFDKALKDVDYALKFGYPARLRPKLILRKAGIYAEQGKRKKAQECLDLLKNCEDEKWKGKIKDIQNVISALSSDSSDDINHLAEEFNRTCLGGFEENDNYTNASDAITLKTSKILGRHVVAGKDLKKDELLYCEEPFASVLLPDYYDSHCHYCHKSLRDQGGLEYFFPCLRCTEVKFCDFPCFEAADNSYHQHECGWLDFINSVGIAHLAIRVVLVAGVDAILECVQNHSLITSLDNLDIWKKGCKNYPRVYSLLDHIDDMYEDDLFQYALVAGLLTKFLSTKTQFFHEVPEESQRKVRGAMLRHICQLICNAHGITKVSSVDAKAKLGNENGKGSSLPGAFDDIEQQRIATAIYPAASMMNHSCGPNINFHFENGRTLIVNAHGRGIMKGEEVLNCYGPTYQRMQREERQECLKQQYFFDCRCQHCKAESTDKKSDSDRFMALKCGRCEGPCLWQNCAPPKFCPNCGEPRDTAEDLKVLKEIRELAAEGDDLSNSNETLALIWKTCYDLAVTILYKDNWRYGEICDRLALYLALSGRREDAKKYLLESLKCVAAMYGEDSVEFQHEAEKYRDLYDEPLMMDLLNDVSA